MATRFPEDRHDSRDFERDQPVRRPSEVTDRDRGYDTDRYEDRPGEKRNFLDRTVDEVRSWFGNEKAERRRGVNEHSYRHSDDPLRDLRTGDVMTRDVMCVRQDDSIETAARMMRDGECGALPVVESDGRLLGMITDRDITVRLVARGAELSRARVEDCMTDETFACHINDPIVSCMRTMSHHQIRRVPVVDDRERVIGIISQSDLARHAGDHPGQGERRAMADVLCAVSAPARAAHRG